jgi:hypothetical protein
VLAGYGPFEVLDADQEERVEGVVIAEFPPFEQTVEWFNGDAYVQARKDRTNDNDYLGVVVDSGVVPASTRSADKPVYVVAVCREIVDQGELNTYWQRVNETLVGRKARVLMDHGRFQENGNRICLPVRTSLSIVVAVCREIVDKGSLIRIGSA